MWQTNHVLEARDHQSGQCDQAVLRTEADFLRNVLQYVWLISRRRSGSLSMLAARRVMTPLASRSFSIRVFAAAAEKPQSGEGALPTVHQRARIWLQLKLKRLPAGMQPFSCCVLLFAGVKSKIYEILTDSKPLTAAELWEQAEVSLALITGEFCWGIAPCMHRVPHIGRRPPRGRGMRRRTRSAACASIVSALQQQHGPDSLWWSA